METKVRSLFASNKFNSPGTWKLALAASDCKIFRHPGKPLTSNKHVHPIGAMMAHVSKTT